MSSNIIISTNNKPKTTSWSNIDSPTKSEFETKAKHPSDLVVTLNKYPQNSNSDLTNQVILSQNSDLNVTNSTSSASQPPKKYYLVVSDPNNKTQIQTIEDETSLGNVVHLLNNTKQQASSMSTTSNDFRLKSTHEDSPHKKPETSFTKYNLKISAINKEFLQNLNHAKNANNRHKTKVRTREIVLTEVVETTTKYVYHDVVDADDYNSLFSSQLTSQTVNQRKINERTEVRYKDNESTGVNQTRQQIIGRNTSQINLKQNNSNYRANEDETQYNLSNLDQTEIDAFEVENLTRDNNEIEFIYDNEDENEDLHSSINESINSAAITEQKKHDSTHLTKPFSIQLKRVALKQHQIAPMDTSILDKPKEWPQTFQFPEHRLSHELREDINDQNIKLTIKVKRELINAVFQEMRSLNIIYPTRDQLFLASQSIITKYPHLRCSESQNGYTSYKELLKGKFANYRRKLDSCEERKIAQQKYTCFKKRKTLPPPDAELSS